MRENKIAINLFPNYLRLLEQIEAFPKSQRYFLELYNASFNLLDKFGKRTQILPFEREFFLEENKQEIDIIHHKTFLEEILFISLTNPSFYKQLYLIRRRGHQTQKLFERPEGIEIELERQEGTKILRGLLSYEPATFQMRLNDRDAFLIDY